MDGRNRPRKQIQLAQKHLKPFLCTKKPVYQFELIGYFFLANVQLSNQTGPLRALIKADFLVKMTNYTAQNIKLFRLLCSQCELRAHRHTQAD